MLDRDPHEHLDELVEFDLARAAKAALLSHCGLGESTRAREQSGNDMNQAIAPRDKRLLAVDDNLDSAELATRAAIKSGFEAQSMGNRCAPY